MPVSTERRDDCSAAWLSEHVEEPSAAGIASAVARLIRDGTLAEGTRLPTVRALAARLHVGPGTVSAAWATLRRQRFIEGGGRAGTRVAGATGGPSPLRYENIVHLWRDQTLNLSRAVPDPALLPDLRPALERAVDDPDLHSYGVQPISPRLRSAVEDAWPFPAQAWMCTRGGYDGIGAVLATSVVAGETVAVQEPATPRLLDLLDQVGARAVPVEQDQDGPRPEALRAAMAHRPSVFLYEPRESSSTGATLSPARQAELAEVLRPHDVLVLEDDPWASLSDRDYHGIGGLLPERTVMVRSYSKSHGPDLRLGVLAGAEAAVERVRVYRHFSDGWTSRILQNALAWMLQDAEVQASVERARGTYARRRAQFVDLLRERGVGVLPGAGLLAIRVPVLSEHQSELVLASHGIAVLGLQDSWSGEGPQQIRLATACPIPDAERVADAVTLAARAR